MTRPTDRRLGTTIVLILAAVLTGAVSGVLLAQCAYGQMDRSVDQRRCGQTLDAANPARYVYQAGCWERDVNQAVASVRTLQNVAFVGVMAGFAGVAYNVNASDPARYHWYQLIGQTSAGYLLYTINTSRGGFLRFLGLQMMTNSVFQAVVNGAVFEECSGPCWTSREPSSWHLDGVGSVLDPWSRRRGAQFAVGAVLTTVGLTMDLMDYAWPGEERVQVQAMPGALQITYRF